MIVSNKGLNWKSLPLIRDVMPKRLTKILSVASEPVNNSAVTYNSGFNFLAASTKYWKWDKKFELQVLKCHLCLSRPFNYKCISVVNPYNHYQVSSTLNYWPVPKGTVRFCSPHNILELPKVNLKETLRLPVSQETSNLVVSCIHVARGFRQENVSHLCSVGEQVTIN